MSDNDACFGNQLLNHDAKGIDGFDAIVNEENLAIASEFGFDGSLNEFFLKGSDDSLDGEAIARRRFNDGHVTKADERHVQGAWNGRGRKGERVHVFAHFLKAFL